MSPTWLVTIVVTLAGLVLLIACWQLVLFALATLMAIAVIASAVVE